jgi:hypothetical protein
MRLLLMVVWGLLVVMMRGPAAGTCCVSATILLQFEQQVEITYHSRDGGDCSYAALV